MEQWFYQLLGPGVPVILEQWNNGLTNFFRGGPEQWNNGFINFWGRGVPLIWEQWNNGFINFWGRGSH